MQAFFGRCGLCFGGFFVCVARCGTCACAHGENSLWIVLGTCFFGLGLCGCHAACNFNQGFASIRFRIENHFGNCHAELKRNRLVFDNGARVHDGHAHAVRDGVMQERCVHRFAEVVVAAECERKVRKAARNTDPREVVHNPADGTDKVDGVGVVFGHAGGDCQDVRVVNDVGRVKVKLLHHDVVSAGRNLYAALVVRGLTFFVKEHHDDGGT